MPITLRPVALALFLLPVLLSACGGTQTIKQPTPTFPVPAPCLGLSHQNDKAAIVGYGHGATLAQAKQQAYADISEQLKVTVNSNAIATVQKQNAAVSSAFEQHIRSQSNATFTGLELVCLDQHTEPGKVHLALRLDLRPLAQTLASHILQPLSPKPLVIHWQAPAAIISSPLLRDMNRHLAAQGEQGEAKLAATLYRDDTLQRWSLLLGERQVALENEQLQQIVNWHALAKGDAQLAVLDATGNLLNTEINNETEYRLALKHPQGGYGQLLGVYENGDIDLLRSNMPIAPNKAYIVPETGGVFEAASLPEQTLTTDTFIVVITAAPLTQSALSTLHRQKKPTRVQQLLDSLEQLQADIAVVQLVVE